MAKKDSWKPPVLPKMPYIPRDDGVCFICAATSSGIGVAKSNRTKPKYYCDHCGLPLALHMIMRDNKLNAVEEAASTKAGEAIGQYLDEIGETDLSKLSKLEFEAFCKRFVAAYIKEARDITSRFLYLPD